MKKTNINILGLRHQFLLFFFYLLTSTALQAQQELILRFHDNTPQDTIDALLQEFNATELAITPLSMVRLWRLDSVIIDPTSSEALFLVGSDSLDIQETGKKARNKLSMLSADPNYYIQIPPPINDGLNPCPEQLAFPEPGNCEIKVAIIDTGVEDTHVDLNSWLWENDQEVLLGVNELDDDNNGYVDDQIGYDFYNHHYHPIDSQSHGTHISGTIVQLFDQIPSANIRLMSLKALNEYGKGTAFAAIEAIDYAINNGAQIINLSIGYIAPPSVSSKPAPMEFAIELAGQLNQILVVCSAGNDGLDIDQSQAAYFPAGFISDNLLSIAAADCDTNLYSFSNYGDTSVDLAAPGLIYSTILNNGWGYKAGTSMAAAVVSGTAALLGSHSCSFNYSYIKHLLLHSVDSINLPLSTEGYLNPNKAFDLLMLGNQPPILRSSTAEANNTLQISPNPFEQQVNLTWEEKKAGETVVELYNGLGQLVQSKTIAVNSGPNQFQLEVQSATSRGIFYVILKNENQTLSRQLLRQTSY